MSEQVFGSGNDFSVQDLIDAQETAQAPAAEGQADNESAPDESGQPEESAPGAEQPATQEPEPAKDGDSKLLGVKFKTEGALFKAANEIGNFLGEQVDFDNMSTAQIEDYYAGARKRLSQRGADEKPDNLQPLAAEMAQIRQLLETQLKKPAEQPAPNSPDEELTDEQLDELFYESPAKAMKAMMAQMVKTSQPQQPSPSPSQPAQPPENAYSVKVDAALNRVRNLINQHGEGDFGEFEPAMERLVNERKAFYQPLFDQSKDQLEIERGIVRLYQDAKTFTATNGQLKTITSNRQAATQTIEKSKQAATIEGGNTHQAEENKSADDQLLDRFFNTAPKKGLWG
jgi:hypothetical protein